MRYAGAVENNPMTAQTDSCISETKNIFRHQKIVDRLLQSDLFQSYKGIFQTATGLPLELFPTDRGGVSACQGSVNQNRFCSLLNSGQKGCGACLDAQQNLMAQGGRGVQSISCFAGLQETAIPIVVEGTIIAQLKTGQVFHDLPKDGQFSDVMGKIEPVESTESDLSEAYLATPVIKRSTYQAMVTLLAAFSMQLTKLAGMIAREETSDGDDPISNAKDYIEEHLSSPIHLEDVAKNVKMSAFHFCRRFKEETGKTLTRYVSERRVSLAREALETSERRITDIAFDAGFQSLSQFNRSFHKITGVSPTVYRQGLLA